ncbi:putative methylmalonate-semialdehyde/malonate-semialdehyde dehydrogenase [acylating], mitochondrial [Caenorhabditis elegans]|uniref:Probable methylmalonate-semialdehyde/malonate-semialdehyde dehydrogenase [acylating], mitochondrial n=1 Tax=Caenorhabditis elegans TaxID=6239 RepID=Q7JMI1_CAEEL|nr:putative methylmalonate-semialdehyde dehydrogenase [acylating], mitochondrial [Caenorhabditis elegans]CAF31502.1 Probable methylmalonate-semialdehyde dehydrogenase [acylating], mitochondrial [Caenorhabditis elegans]|eukprot:NP_001022079.1 ALdehyde deHydrogenase [Caenorhabditis elegans]
MLSRLARVQPKCQQLAHFSTSKSAAAAPTVKLWIDGQAVESKTTDFVELTNPATNEVIAMVPNATQAEMQAAVDSAKNAFNTWKNTSFQIPTDPSTMHVQTSSLDQERHEEAR